MSQSQNALSVGRYAADDSVSAVAGRPHGGALQKRCSAAKAALVRSEIAARSCSATVSVRVNPPPRSPRRIP
jgi:hypothetical protein